MPNYDYLCEKCNHTFESLETYDNREKPTTEPCPECSEQTIIRTIGGFPGVGCDSNITPDKKTGGQWSEMMNRVKKGLPKSHHAAIDRSTNMTGHRWKG